MHVFNLGTRGRGKYLVEWDRTDVAGRAVRSGVYFAQLRTTEKFASQKLVLVR